VTAISADLNEAYVKPTIHDATHVAFDMPTVDRLSKLGAMNVVRASGRLIVGPNRLEPEEHARVRAGFFGSPDGDGDQLDSSEVRWQPPVAVWLSGSLQERVSLWRVLHRLHALGIPHPNVFPIDVETVAPAGVGEGSSSARSIAVDPSRITRTLCSWSASPRLVLGRARATIAP
jgi:hypothetical protein